MSKLLEVNVEEEIALSTLSLVRSRLRDRSSINEFDECISLILEYTKNKDIQFRESLDYTLAAHKIKNYAESTNIFIDSPNDPCCMAIYSILLSNGRILNV